MRALITGSSGAVGTALVAALKARGDEVVAWDRTAVSPIDPAASETFIGDTAPDALFHLATAAEPTGIENESWRINVAWPAALARICRQQDVSFLFSSSVMVFSNEANGPFTLASQPDAAEGYGLEKRQAEENVLSGNPQAIVARLGWQIGDAPGSNNMVDFLEKTQQEHGRIPASKLWYPACSFLPDTAQMLLYLLDCAPGLYQIDANEHWTFYEIAAALNKKHGDRWQVSATGDFTYDQRLIDPRVPTPSLNTRLDLP